ncbi:hypothetical protein NKJ84_28285 [Mesorhizobium sp. M0048]|uniref:hypothetical protein n=1 Tax=Mesorhizobium sp. M0048 TaxID=2956860 RepID=UPI003335D1EF
MDLYIFCDWIEASALFLKKEVTGSDLIDILTENNIYKSQAFAWELVNDAFSIVDVRARLIGEGYPLVATADGVAPKGDWGDYTPYAFCLMLSMAKSHGVWVRDTFGTDFTAQGELFERLTAEAVTIAFRGWSVHATGWTRTRTARIKQVVEGVCTQLNEAAGEVLHWTAATAKEAGLDLVTYRPFADGNVGVPVYLWQCASGMDWVHKRKTPDLALWQRIVSWAVTPRKAMAMPFALSDTEMRQHSVIVEGLLLDRHRLLEPGMDNRDWVSDDLRGSLIDWLRPRIAVVPIFAMAAI